MKYRHYAPKGRLTIYRGNADAVAKAINQACDEGGHPVILALTSHLPSYAGRETMSLGETLLDAAHNLFSCLREADHRGYDRLLAEAVSEEAVGLAVMNRMARAAAFDVVDDTHEGKGG